MGYCKMKIVEINTVDYGSTGKIMMQIAECARENGHEVYTFSRAWKNNKSPADGHTYFGSYPDNLLHRILGPVTGREGSFSKYGTQQLLKKLDKIQPDLIHIHNLHGWYINYSLLFQYIKQRNIAVVWTLHDCWSFTGQCPYFTMVRCEKWKTGCHHCPQHRQYPESYPDRSKKMWELKKELFTGLEKMTIVTPSKWLLELVGQSFLKDYPIRLIHNGIDLSVFKPTSSDFRAKHHIPAEKKILLGVSFGWGIRKGLDVFIELAKRLDSNKYQIVLVGTDDNVDMQLPKNIISVHRTKNQLELAEIYTAADLFVNPTREEVLGMVNIESLACGTPVLTFRTGGSPEILDESTGAVVDCDDVNALESEIIRICRDVPYSKADCFVRAKSFDMNKKYKEYIELYNEK